MKPFDELESLVSSKVEAVKTTLTLVKLESRLAGLSVFPLVLNTLMLLIVLTTFWVTLVFLIGYGLVFFSASIVLASGVILLLHGILLAGLARYWLFNLRSMSFEKTRKFLFDTKDRDELEKTAFARHSSDRKKVAVVRARRK